MIGHEIGFTRPCVIFSSLDQVQLATIIPITSSLKASRLPFTFQIKADSKNGLDKDSTALIFQLRTLSFDRFNEKIGKLSDEQFDMIKTLVMDYLHLNTG
jgi:mRNA interferase MazF